MALPRPILDNRTYEQLRDELVARIPVYAPEWTNHNASDPGIALLELFAHLGESLLYRFNQIPEATQVEFFRLLGVRPRPARSATVLLAMDTDLPAGVQVLPGTEVPAGDVAFETDDETYAWPLDVLAAGKTPEEPLDTRQGRESSADALARAGVRHEDARFYRTSVLSADPLAADAAPVDVNAQVDAALWVALLRRQATDVTKLAGGTVFVGVAFDEKVESPPALEQLGRDEAEAYGSAVLTRDPPPVLWQLLDETGAAAPFRTLQVIGDTTRGMLTSGVVKVVLPETFPERPGPTSGGVDAPPPLDDAEQAGRVLAWLRVSRPSTADIGDVIGRVRWVGINAVGATQVRTAPAELLGSGSGDAGQQFALAHRPVVPGSVRLQVDELAGWTSWDEVGNFAASRADDRHFMVDAEAGTITFGRQRVPQIGQRIGVTGYRYGGGTAGNVAAGAFAAPSGVGAVTAHNPLPAVGGADSPPLVEALEAIPAIVHRHDRAVVAGDFEALAAEVPGVARADTLTRLHPDNPTDDAAGVVSVVVLGEQDARRPEAPMPDLGLLRRVARYLDARRLVTTELYVIPPEYVPIVLSVGVRVRNGYPADAVRRWVDRILRQYLAVLPPDGPEGGGWPLGRSVRRAELEAVAVQVEGVEYLEDLLLSVVGADGAATPVPLVELRRWQLPAVVGLTVTLGPPLALGAVEESRPAPGGAPGQGPVVPVHLPSEVC